MKMMSTRRKRPLRPSLKTRNKKRPIGCEFEYEVKLRNILRPYFQTTQDETETAEILETLRRSGGRYKIIQGGTNRWITTRIYLNEVDLILLIMSQPPNLIYRIYKLEK